ncbi:ABC transporter substrate-binding protein [Rhizobium esperanzae]|uniref:Polar amino acid transport system substrate-binding protein n=1 Tax=Rhizobium esperanzae TaxID=1967781 RepID=A0A7W6R3R6_9HYPH|nr:ABC transporter substrate-binding protein [Rhizobium esperanzae]MBB4236240.1 polar amino acid transport system substrate-binding protein [Rhizobium esperanzae]
MSKILCNALVLGGIAAANAAWAADLPKSDDVTSTGKLTILSTMDYAPFEFLDKSGKPDGLDIELAQAAAEALGAKLDIVTTPFPSIFPSITAGRGKIAWSTFTATPERLKIVNFVTFLKSGIVLVTPADKASRFKSKDDLCGAKVAVHNGSSGDFAADKLSTDCKAAGKPEIEKSLYPQQQNIIQAVLSGRVDGYFDDTTAALYYVGTTKGAMVVAPGEYFPLPLGIAIPKDDPKTAEMLQKVLQHLMDNGTYAKVLAKYEMGPAAVQQADVISSADQLPQ